MLELLKFLVVDTPGNDKIQKSHRKNLSILTEKHSF